MVPRVLKDFNAYICGVKQYKKNSHAGKLCLIQLQLLWVMAGARGWQANRGCRLVVLKWVYWRSLHHLPLLAVAIHCPQLYLYNITVYPCGYPWWTAWLVQQMKVLQSSKMSRTACPLTQHYIQEDLKEVLVSCYQTHCALPSSHCTVVTCIYCWVDVRCRYKWLQVLDCILYGDLKRCSLLTLLVW